MVKKKSKIILLSIIALLIMSAVSMFVYGCFCLNKKQKGSKADTFTNETTHGTMGWSSNDWAWSGNDDYGLPESLPVPAVFMRRYTIKINKAIGEESDSIAGGIVKTRDNTSLSGTSDSIEVRVFKDQVLTEREEDDKRINCQNITEMICEAHPDDGYKFVKWIIEENSITAQFEKIAHEVYYYDGSVWKTIGGQTFNTDIENDQNKIFGSALFTFNIGQNVSGNDFSYTAKSGDDVGVDYSKDNYHIIGWEYSAVTKYYDHDSNSETQKIIRPNTSTPTDFKTQNKTSVEDVLRHIFGDSALEPKEECCIFIRPVWGIDVYSVIIQTNSSDPCNDSCLGGYVGPKQNGASQITDSTTGIVSELNIGVSYSFKTDDIENISRKYKATISGIPYNSKIICSKDNSRVELKYGSVSLIIINLTPRTAHSYAEEPFSINNVVTNSKNVKGNTTINAYFKANNNSVTGYTYTDGITNHLEVDPTEAITTNYCYCENTKALASFTEISTGVDVFGYDLFSATQWKIGPFTGDDDDTTRTFTSGFNANYTAKRDENVLTIAYSTAVSIKYTLVNVNGSYGKMLDLNGTANDGYYYFISTINKGSYGNLDKLANKPVITPYWERNSNYLIYYNDTTEATFHTDGQTGINGYEVEVEKTGAYIYNKNTTERSCLNGEVNLDFNIESGTIGSIAFTQSGYAVVGFRYKLIDLNTTPTQVNTVSEANGWYYIAGIDGWEINNIQMIGKLVDTRGKSLDPTSTVYAICVQPIMELVPYTATFTIMCNEDDSQHGGSFTADNIVENGGVYKGTNDIVINEREKINTILTYVDGFKNSDLDIEYNPDNYTKVIIGNIVYNMSYAIDSNKLSFKYLSNNDVKITANVGQIDEVDLYSFVDWSKGDATIQEGQRDAIDGPVNLVAHFEPETFTTSAYYRNDGGVPTSASDYKTIDYFYCKVEDSNLDSLDNIEGKYFDTWQVGPFNSSGYFINSSGNAIDYSATISGSVLTFKGYGKKVNFNLLKNADGSVKGPVKDINNHLYYLLDLDNEIKGYQTKNGNYGDLSIIGGRPVVTARWASIYDLKVLNDGTLGTPSIWVPGEGINLHYDYLGVKGQSGSSNPEITGKEFNVKIDTRQSIANNYKFITNQNFAFFKNEDTTNNPTANVSMIGEDKTNWFGIYNYGYRLKGWRINVSYEIGNTPYSYYINKTDVNGPWIKNNSAVNIPVGTLTGSTLGGDAGLSGLLDDLYTAGINVQVNLTIYPEWEAARINVYEVGQKSDLYTGNEKYSTPRNTSGIINFNNNYSLVNGSTFNGCSFAIYRTANGNVPIVAQPATTNKKWNYYNIDCAEFAYENGIYNLNVISYSVSNIYKVTLYGIKVDNNFKMLIEGSDYQNVATTSYGGYTYYNHAYGFSGDTKYPNTSRVSKYKYNVDEYWLNDYSIGLNNKIEEYVADIKDGSHDLLRKVYSNEIGSDYKLIEGKTTCSAYIYLAHGYRTGKMPAFDHENYELIFWENQNTNNIYKTNLFDAVEEPGHAQDAEGKTSLEGDNQKWSLNEGKNNIILNAHYFRKYYYINPEVRENGSIDQVGYLIINSEDVIENDPDVTNEYEGTYLAIALKEKETDTEYKMHYYIIKDKNVDYTDDFSLSKITIDGIKVKYDGTELKECKNNDTNNIKIYSGCTLTVNVFDQSKDPDGMASEKFDTMIGHKYKDGSMLDNSTDEYDNTIEFVKDGVEIGENVDPLGEYFGYINGESTTFTFNFEKIVYNLKIKIDNNNAGQFTVQTPVDGIQTLRNVQVNNLKVGDTIRLTYKASLGYDLQEGALRFEIDGVVNDFSYTLVSREVIGGYITQEFVFDFDGTWLRENYYCKDSSTGNVKFYLTDRKSGDSADGVDLGLITIKTELIDFDYKIKLLNTLGESVGEINGFGLESEKWQVTDETLVISNAVVPDGNGNHVVEYDSKNYAMIESYFEEYMGGKNLFHEVYKFPLESYSEVQYKVAENLKFIYSFDTTIISTNVRTIYSVIVVEPIYTLTLRLDSTDNIVMTMSNNSNNLEVYPTNTVTYENRDGVGTGDVTLQTYRGLENSITSSFDIILFDKIYYSVDDTHTGYVPGQTFNFSVESDTEIVATLNKAYHKYNIRYFVNGEEVGSRPNDLLKDANPSDLIVYNNILPDGSFAHTTAPDGYVVLRDIIKPMYKLKTDKYILTIEIGDRTYYVDSATGYVETIEIIREHLNSSYKFDIKVCLTEISNDTIRISLKLADNDQNRDGSGYYDDYGTFKVYVDNLAPVSSDVNSRGKLIKAYSRKILKVELNLTKGYRYTGKVQINSNANNPETRAINSNIIILEEEFDTTKGIRDYYILIEKEELDFVFVDSDERNYRFDNINSTNDDRTIVGDQIKLSQSAESNTEEFGYYYIKKGEDKIVISDNENTTFRISPDMIYDGKVTVCVATIKYYAVYIEMTNDSIDRLKVNYVGEGANQKGYRDFTATAGDTDVALNTLVYVPEGDLNISMSAKAQEKYTYWYKIGNGVENQIAEVSGIASTTIEINNDMVIVLNIRPVEFTDIDVTEYHDDQEVVNDENKISNAIANSYAFDTEAEIELVYINEEFIMTTLKITGNEVDDTIVYIDRVKGISIDGETYDYSVNVNGYNIEFYTDNYGVQKIKISYLIADSIGLEVYYTSLIEIKPY